MKGSILAAAAALLGSATAGHLENRHGHAHAHELFEKRGDDVCTTYYTTITGSMIWTPTPGFSSNKTVAASTSANYTIPVAVTTTKTTTSTSTSLTSTSLSSSSTPIVTPSSSSVAPVTLTSTATVVPVPTAAVETCPTPGTYTFPATTLVVTETTTVCGATTVPVTSGTNTIGGVTTVVETATTVVCPYATTTTASGGVVTSVLSTTTYVCPSAGTYTIAPITTVVVTDTVVVCPVVSTFVPGTYTKTAVTTTVVETDVVIYCPYATSSASSVAVAVPTTTVAVAAEVTTAAAVVVASSSSAKATSTATASTSTSTFATLGGGDQWAMTYTPYTSSGDCKSAADVLSDITNIKNKGFTTVRVYSTDCDTLPNVGAACAAQELKMILGVFIGEVGCDNDNPDVASQIAAIESWGQWDLVELVVVGNEAGNDGYCTASELSSLIVQVKDIVASAGASCPVTTTDTVNMWEDTEFATAICAVVDVVACNAHAYFNAETTPAMAGDFVQGQLDIVKEICGLEGYVLETGWPSECVANGVATCSTEDQETAITALKQVVGGSVVFFSFSDDDWKDNGSCGCEQHWGCGQLF